MALTNLLAGCVGDRSDGSSDEPAPPPPDPDAKLRLAFVDGSTGLIQRYAATVERYPELRSRLQPYEKRHRAHRSAFEAGISTTPTPTPTSKRKPSPSPTPVVLVPRPASKAVLALVEAERDLASARRERLADIADPELARLVASVVACGRTHTSELAELA